MGSINGQKHNPYIEGRYAHINKNDVVFTPDWLARQICEMFDIGGVVLEPCKGEGVFLKYLPNNAEWCEIADGVMAVLAGVFTFEFSEVEKEEGLK